jgi:hypothetical protein
MNKVLGGILFVKGTENKLIKDTSKLSGEDTREGIIAVISVKVEEPQFEGQTKTKLGTDEIKGFTAKAMEEFFKDIAYKYPDFEFKTDSTKFYIRLKPANPKEPWRETDVAGYGFTLSTASNKKSISYPNVTLLIYDEFLLNKGNQKYLYNEPESLLELYETVARPGTNHPRVVLFMLANAISITNPFFLFFGLKMPQKQDKNGKWVWKHPTKPILVEDVKNEAFIDRKKETEFGKLIEGTKYADYSIENKFLLDDDTFIEHKTSGARYFFTFIYKDHELGVWADFKEGKMYVSKDIDPTYPIKYSITMKDHTPNTMFIKDRSKALKFKRFLDNYKLGNVRFENMNVKNITYEVIQMTLT